MARTKKGVFSWEDVLAQRYQSELTSPERSTVSLFITTPDLLSLPIQH